MGSVMASANPTTLTGSIGVFGLLPNAGKLMDQKLGISTETVNTNKNSDFPSVFRPMTSYEKVMMQNSVDKIYSDFVSKVSSGRNMSFESVDSIGQGRLWSGADAIGIGLVDHMAGLTASIDSAAAMAGVDKYSIKELPVQEEPYAKLISQLSGDVRLRILKKELGESFRFLEELRAIRELSGIQARMPYFIDIH